MARIGFDESYVSSELEKVGNTLIKPVNLYLLGGAAMIRYGLKAATKDIDVLFSTRKEADELVLVLEEAGYNKIEVKRLTPEYKMMSATRILENADGFRWDIFHEYVCKKLRLSSGMIKRAKLLFKTGQLNVRIISKEDIFLLKSVTQRDDDEDDLLVLARSGLNWEAILTECIAQSRHDMMCEIDLYDKLDKLRTSYGLETPIGERISKKSKEQMERWFEDAILQELAVNPMTLAELLERFRCDKEILLPSLTELEISGKIEQIKGKFSIKCIEDCPR